MSTASASIAGVLAALYPDLTEAGRARLGEELARLIDTGLTEGWIFESVVLAARSRRLSPFRVTLRQLRVRARLTQAQAAKAGEWSSAKISRIENGAVGVTASDIHFLVRLYGVTDSAMVGWLLEQARLSRQRASGQ